MYGKLMAHARNPAASPVYAYGAELTQISENARNTACLRGTHFHAEPLHPGLLDRILVNCFSGVAQVMMLHPNIIVHVENLENVVSLFSSPSISSQKVRKCGGHKFFIVWPVGLFFIA